MSERLSFAPGDLFALLTDGVIETGENPDAARGLEQVSDVLRRSRDAALPEIVSAMLAEATQNGAQHDDATVLLLRCSETAGGYEREKLDVPLTKEAIWNRQLDALEELLAREEKASKKGA